MKEKNKLYDMYGNEMVDKSMPSMKQTEEKPTNISIECVICSRMVEEFVRIVKVISATHAVIKGICCYKCTITHKLNPNVFLIDKDNNVIDRETIGLNTNMPRYVGYDDGTKKAYEDRDKYRKRVGRIIKRNNAWGLKPITFKEEMQQKKDNPLDYLPLKVRLELIRRYKNGELKIKNGVVKVRI